MQNDSRAPENSYQVTDSAKIVSSDYICIRCNTRGQHFAHKCFALKLKCQNCKKIGHVAKACRKTVPTAATNRQHHRVTADPRNNLLDESETSTAPRPDHTSASGHSQTSCCSARPATPVYQHQCTSHGVINPSSCCSLNAHPTYNAYSLDDNVHDDSFLE